VDELANDRKFAKMKNLVYDMPTRANSGSRYSKGRAAEGAVGVSALPADGAVTAAVSRASGEEGAPEMAGTGAVAHKSAQQQRERKTSEKSGLATVALRLAVEAANSGGAVSVQLPLQTTLRLAITKLLSESPMLQSAGAVDYSRMEVRFPLPRRRLSETAEELDRLEGTRTIPSPSAAHVPISTFFS
jgi:hypothetical protein